MDRLFSEDEFPELLSPATNPSTFSAMVTKVGAKGRQRVPKYPYIPEEIVLSVLQNLPIKSLLRFRCVSKQWCRWICKGESRKKLLVVSRNSCNSHSFWEINQKVAQLEVLDAPPSWAGASYVHTRGSCNGLLLMGIDDNLYLWNPSIRWYSHISSYDLYGDYYVAIAGLCFDSTRNEYKAVLAWKHSSSDYGAQHIHVYSLRNKSRKLIKDFPYDVGSGKAGPSMNGCLHWIVSANVEDDHFFAPEFIVCFEAKTDEFEKFPMPDVPKGKEGNPVLGLGVLDGCLCMVLCEENALYEGPVEVLSMKEYGVKESWMILFRIEDINYGQELVPCFYSGEGNTNTIMKVTSGWHDWSVRVYNTNDASFVKDITPLLERGNAIVYEETFQTNMTEENIRQLDRHKHNVIAQALELFQSKRKF